MIRVGIPAKVKPLLNWFKKHGNDMCGKTPQSIIVMEKFDRLRNLCLEDALLEDECESYKAAWDQIFVPGVKCMPPMPHEHFGCIIFCAVNDPQLHEAVHEYSDKFLRTNYLQKSVLDAVHFIKLSMSRVHLTIELSARENLPFCLLNLLEWGVKNHVKCSVEINRSKNGSGVAARPRRDSKKPARKIGK
ncbi:hypothetical protein METSCH_F01260 [Metschnikowia aff. pulcherrima]|uniref:Uncharacterized protein n=1 Tax=Metschnikowia aff. pulcherrima TaxID=2163413 RepID=A0A4P6XUL7_9ASCO|nr:hypothetical protein METSCH_F01260 [Metschnikowia aff. pulcherrima]